MKYFVIAGEASGDLHAGRLIAALRNADSSAEFRFLGGDFMEQAAGVSPVIHYKRMAYMGFGEVVRHLPEILGFMRTAKEAIREFRPDALVLVDYPSFNLKMAKFAESIGIPVYYYISPKVWAWKEHRVKAIKRYVRRVYSILPFEVGFFAKHGYEVTYTGNPTVSEIAEARTSFPGREAFLEAHGIADRRQILALLPGSRLSEIRSNLPLMAEAAARYPEYQAIIAGAPNVDAGVYRDALSGIADLPVVYDATYALVANAVAALVTSGTATLETAVIGTPQVVCYRHSGSRLFYAVFKHVLKVPFVSLPNLIADKAVVSELLLHKCTADSIAHELEKLLGDTAERRNMLAGYKTMSDRLGEKDSAGETARLLVEDLKSLKS